MMARYIDADKMREYWLENGVNENVYSTNDVLNSIDYQPTADVEEVVRCKDCKKFIKKDKVHLDDNVFGYCEKSITSFYDDGEEVYGNDFCSYGERRTDDER